MSLSVDFKIYSIPFSFYKIKSGKLYQIVLALQIVNSSQPIW